MEEPQAKSSSNTRSDTEGDSAEPLIPSLREEWDAALRPPRTERREKAQARQSGTDHPAQSRIQAALDLRNHYHASQKENHSGNERRPPRQFLLRAGQCQDGHPNARRYEYQSPKPLPLSLGWVRRLWRKITFRAANAIKLLPALGTCPKHNLRLHLRAEHHISFDQLATCYLMPGKRGPIQFGVIFGSLASQANGEDQP
jgi:hypothetical protein